METALISDLHLSAASEADLLGRADIRAKLIEAVSDADRLVLLGDIIELRDGPIDDALDGSQGFFEDIGRAFAGKQVVLVPGNHDHRLLGPWIERRRKEDREDFDLSELVTEPHKTVRQVAEWLGEAELEVRYPGIWVRDDVYATHGHYLDSHITLPTIERLSVALVDRVGGGNTGERSSPDDYERYHAPVYGLLFELAQGARTSSGDSPDGKPVSMRTWELMGGASGRARTIRGKLLRSAVVPSAVKALQRFGFGRFGRDFSLAEIGRAGVDAMHDVVRSLGIDAEHVIFGHIHRRGPLPGEDGAHASDPEWHRAGTTLYNTGCWIYVDAMLGRAPSDSPFWPGRAIVVCDEGPPEAIEVLGDASHAELAGSA